MGSQTAQASNNSARFWSACALGALSIVRLHFHLRCSSPSLFPESFDESIHPLHRLLDLVARCRETAPQVPLAAGPKSIARHTRDLLLLQQSHRKLLRLQACRLDAG